MNKTDPKLELKKEYNTLLARVNKAEAYLNDANIPVDERLKWGPLYNELCIQLGAILQQLGGFTGDEWCNGFDIPVQDSLFEGEEVIAK